DPPDAWLAKDYRFISSAFSFQNVHRAIPAKERQRKSMPLIRCHDEMPVEIFPGCLKRIDSNHISVVNQWLERMAPHQNQSGVIGIGTPFIGNGKYSFRGYRT